MKILLFQVESRAQHIVVKQEPYCPEQVRLAGPIRIDALLEEDVCSLEIAVIYKLKFRDVHRVPRIFLRPSARRQSCVIEAKPL